MDNQFPDSFVYLADIDLTIIQSVRYATAENFVGSVIRGYDASKIIMKRVAAVGLSEAQKIFTAKGYSLVVYDGYRPRRAVQHFVEWSQSTSDMTKAKYYPTLSKESLLDLGFIATRSIHSQGYAVDLSIAIAGHQPFDDVVIRSVTLADGEVVPWLDDGTVNMGTGFDLFHECSFPDSTLVSHEAQENRKLLTDVMTSVGFTPNPTEWWHFNFPPEEYDFVIQ
jgi:D-alanyl-D-alanine dipeptidase